jgi:hypothetical protein
MMKNLIVVIVLLCAVLSHVYGVPCLPPLYRDGCGKCSSAGAPFAYGPSDCIGDALLADTCGTPNGDTGALPCVDATSEPDTPFFFENIMHIDFGEADTHGLGLYPGQILNRRILHAPWAKIGPEASISLPLATDMELIKDGITGSNGALLMSSTGLTMAWSSTPGSPTSTYSMGEYGIAPGGLPSTPFSGTPDDAIGFSLKIRPLDGMWVPEESKSFTSFSSHIILGQTCESGVASPFFNVYVNGTDDMLHVSYTNPDIFMCIRVSAPFPKSVFNGKLMHLYIKVDRFIGGEMEIYIDGIPVATHIITPSESGSYFVSDGTTPMPASFDTMGFTLNGLLNGEQRGDFEVFQYDMFVSPFAPSTTPLTDSEIFTLAEVDVCGVSFGTNSTCGDICGVPNGDNSSCCTFDCFNVCNGTAVFDCNNVCEGPGVLDCNGTCDGSSVIDLCGVCGGDSSLCCVFDCLSVCNGTSTLDCNSVCNGPGVLDCNGTCDGSSTFDCNSVCNGPSVLDCNGTCDGTSVLDCNSVCNGAALFDACNICNGANTVIFFDFCGIECGDNSTCFTPDEFQQKNSSFIHRSECSIELYNVTTLMFPPTVGSDTIYVTIQAHAHITPNVTDAEVTIQCNNQTLADKLNAGWQSSTTGDMEWFENTVKIVDLFMCFGAEETDGVINVDGNILIRTQYLNNTFNEEFNYESECCIQASLINVGTSTNEFRVFGNDAFCVDIDVISNDIVCNDSCADSHGCELTHVFRTCIPHLDGTPTALSNPVIDPTQTSGSPGFYFVTQTSECDPSISDRCCQTWTVKSNNTQNLNCFTTTLNFQFDHIFNGSNCFDKTIDRPHFIDVCRALPTSVEVTNFDASLILYKDAAVTTVSNSFIDGGRIYGELILGPLSDSDCQKYILFIKEGRLCVPISSVVGPITGCDDPNAVKHVFLKASVGYSGGTYFSTAISSHPTFPACTSKAVISWFARLLNSFSSNVIVELDWSFSISNVPYGLLNMSPMKTFRKTFELPSTTKSVPYKKKYTVDHNNEIEHKNALVRYGLQGDKHKYKLSQSHFKVACGDGYVFNGQCELPHSYISYNNNVWLYICIAFVPCAVGFFFWKLGFFGPFFRFMGPR